MSRDFDVQAYMDSLNSSIVIPEAAAEIAAGFHRDTVEATPNAFKRATAPSVLRWIVRAFR